MPEYYALQGIKDGLDTSKRVPVRLEIDDWWTSTDEVHAHQRSLLILAMLHMQKIRPTDPEEGKLSWYQIAGIHGEPHVAWDDSPGGNADYCQHSNVLFSTWHRPYALLLEQRLYEVMKTKIIPEHYDQSEQEVMLAAAREWRWPFWDWAAKKKDADGEENYNIPRVVRLPEVEVQTKQGTYLVRNPFYSYKLPGGRPFNDARPAAEGGFGEFAIAMNPVGPTTQTSRHYLLYQPVWMSGDEQKKKLEDLEKGNPVPVTMRSNVKSPKWVKGSQNNDNIMYEIAASKFEEGGNLSADWQEAVLRILRIPRFEDFATARTFDDYNPWSVEGLHNRIHNYCGGSQMFTGHMSFQEVAGFDPIFWLHHANVDRIIAFWQALHPDNEWFKESEDAQRNLLPFHRNTQGEFHTSETIEDTATLGYTYPGLEYWLPEHQTNGKFDPQKLKSDLKMRINKKYASTRRAEQKATLSMTREEPAALSITSLESTAPANVPDIWTEITQNVIATTEAENSQHEVPASIDSNDYVAVVKYKRFGLNGEPFTIHLFVGPVPDERPYNFTDQTTQIDYVYNFVAPLPKDGEKGCENCQRQAAEDVECADGIVLTNALLTRYKQKIPHSKDTQDYLRSMDPNDVAEFLKKHLHWRVTTQRGDEIDMSVDRNNKPRDPRLPRLGLKVAVLVGKATHYEDDSKLSEYGEYKVMYEVTEDAASGTGVKPDDGTFQAS